MRPGQIRKLLSFSRVRACNLRYFSWLLLYFGLALACAGAAAPRAPRRRRPPPNAPIQTARAELFLEEHNSEVHVQPLPADSTVVVLLGREQPLSNKSEFSFQQYDQALHLRQERRWKYPRSLPFPGCAPRAPRSTPSSCREACRAGCGSGLQRAPGPGANPAVRNPPKPRNSRPESPRRPPVCHRAAHRPAPRHGPAAGRGHRPDAVPGLRV